MLYQLSRISGLCLLFCSFIVSSERSNWLCFGKKSYSVSYTGVPLDTFDASLPDDKGDSKKIAIPQTQGMQDQEEQQEGGAVLTKVARCSAFSCLKLYKRIQSEQD